MYLMSRYEGSLSDPYELQSVIQTPPPNGSDGLWFKYVIKQGSTVTVGTRSGSESEVNDFVRNMVDRLNERRYPTSRSYNKAVSK